MNFVRPKFLITRKEQLVFFFCGMLFNSGIAQQEITTTDVLLGARHVEQIQLDSMQVVSLQNYNHNLPVIDNLEFRSETRDFLLRKQEYALRLKPNSLREILANKKVYRSKIEEVAIQSQINYKKELEYRYEIVINHIFNKKLATAYQERKLQLEDKLTILQHSVYDENFDVNDVVQTEEALFEVTTALQELNLLGTHQNKALQLMVSGNPTSVHLNSYDLITPAQIMASYTTPNVTHSLEIQRKQSELEVIENELKLDVAKSKRIVDFVQAKYTGSNSDVFDEKFSISLGVNLPFFGSTREKRSEHYFDKLDVENEIRVLQKKQLNSRQEATENFKNTVSKYTAFQNQIENSSVSSLLDTYKTIEGVNPLTLMRLKISTHNKNIELLKLEYRLYKTYIKMLAFENVLFQSPFKNYIASRTFQK